MRPPVRKKPNNSPLYFSLGAVAVAVAAAAVLFTGASGQAKINRDDVTLCPAGAAPSHTLVMADTSDRLNTLHQQQALAVIEGSIASLPRHGRLSVTRYDLARPYDPVELVSRCNPGRGTDADWNEGSVPLETAWREKFIAPVREAFALLPEAGPQDGTWLFEGIASLSRRPDFREGERKMVVISDGLQNSPDFSMYKVKPGKLHKAFKKSQLASDVPPDLSGVDVEFVYLVRPEFRRSQTKEQRAFLRWYFIDYAKAKSFRFSGISDTASHEVGP